MEQRTSKGTWAPGTSGNPGGRRPEQRERERATRRRVLEATNDGQDLVEYMLAVFRDPRSTKYRRWLAARWLGDRAFGIGAARCSSGAQPDGVTDDNTAREAAPCPQRGQEHEP